MTDWPVSQWSACLHTGRPALLTLHAGFWESLLCPSSSTRQALCCQPLLSKSSLLYRVQFCSSTNWAIAGNLKALCSRLQFVLLSTFAAFEGTVVCTSFPCMTASFYIFQSLHSWARTSCYCSFRGLFKCLQNRSFIKNSFLLVCSHVNLAVIIDCPMTLHIFIEDLDTVFWECWIFLHISNTPPTFFFFFFQAGSCIALSGITFFPLV